MRNRIAKKDNEQDYNDEDFHYNNETLSESRRDLYWLVRNMNKR